jgi:hypothetical protein
MTPRVKIVLAMVFALLTLPDFVGQGNKEPPVLLGAQRPIVAIWRQSDGHRLSSDAPYLRVALWEDGRVLFAADPGKWEHHLQEGRITGKDIIGLKKRIAETGVFDLKGTCYLVPDAPVDCVMADFGGRRQMLYWDEVESPNYGINIAPKPRHLKFKECWKDVNRLLIASCPKLAKPVMGRFGPVPKSWNLKPAVQSE